MIGPHGSRDLIHHLSLVSSVTRPPQLLRDIFRRAGLSIVKEFKQNKFPKELYDVHMFALQPAPAL